MAAPADKRPVELLTVMAGAGVVHRTTVCAALLLIQYDVLMVLPMIFDTADTTPFWLKVRPEKVIVPLVGVVLL
jgi:hypothetical protein